MSVDVLIKDGSLIDAEGPHWDEANGTLLYVDINGGTVHRWDSKTGVDETYKFDTFVCFIIPRQQGGYIIGLGKQIALFDWDTKQITVLHTLEEGKETRLNEGKCDPAGRLWCGTMGLEKGAAEVEPNLGSLYCLDTDGALVRKKEGTTISNGVAWTSDHKTMFFIDSIPRKVYSYDYNLSTGNISDERVIVDLENKTLKDYGYPDGMTIDTEDKIWVACFFAGKIFRFDPVTGQEIGSVSIPAKRTTSCCFGGPKFDDLFVTCSNCDLTEEEKAETPLTGSVYRITGLGAKGLPAFVFKG